MRNKKSAIILCGIFTALFLSLFTNISTGKASAAVGPESIYKKTLLNAIKTCYSDDYMKKTISGTDFQGIGDLMAGSQSIINSATGSKGFRDGVIKVPTQYGNTLSDADMSCYQLFAGWKQNSATNSAKGLISLYNKSITEDKLPKLGYEKQEGSTGGGYRQGCFSFSYKAPNGSGASETFKTNKICVDVDQNNKIDVSTPPEDKGGASEKGFVFITIDGNYILNIIETSQNNTTAMSHSLNGLSWDSFKTEFTDVAKRINSFYDPFTSTRLGLNFETLNADLGNEDHYIEYKRSADAADKALHFFAGSSKTWASIKFNDKDRYTLYTAYIERYIKDTGKYPAVYIGSDDTCSNKLDDAKKDTGYAYRKDKSTWCPLYGVEDGGVPELNGIASDNKKLTGMPFKDIVKEMMKSKYDTYAPAEGTNNIDTPDPVDPNGEDEGSPCSKAGQALGWIICPVAQLVSTATSKMYDKLEQDYLQTNPEYVINTETAWEQFRDFANIIFAIALVVIIFSQITGFGVSNYGIKKMLPTLIIVAVLVNISFFLCEIAVDLSNVVGRSIKAIFDGIKIGTDADVSIGGLVEGLALTIFEGSAVIGAAALAFNTYEFWLLPLLLMMLIAFIAVICFFVTLGIRQAGIIVLVALSPVAIICYVLPNTKNIFSRWWKMFIGLLLVYPICGALMGGGAFVSRLMLGVAAPEDMGFFYALVAVLIQAVPFFFIPTILRSSMTAMGNIGNRLSMFGNRFGRNATGAIRKSNAYKDRQARLAGHQAKRMFNREDWNRRHKILGYPGRLKDRAGAKIRSGNSRLAEMANNSYNRKQARRIDTMAAQRAADRQARMTVAGGLKDVERRERDNAMKNYESSYRGDDDFINDFAAQSRAYEDAIEKVDRDPNDANALAQLRALQNVLGSSADGQDIIQNVLHRRLAAAQARGEITISDGMKAAGKTLISDHGGFKSGNRGLNRLAQDLGNGEALDSSKGKYAVTARVGANGHTATDKAGNQIYENDHYANFGAKGSATELAGANDNTLDSMLSSIRNGNMSATDMEAAYRNASEAITNNNISVKPEAEDKLNAIRQAAYDKLQGQQVNGYTDNTGREFAHTGGNNYQYTDSSGNVHNYTRSAAGDLNEVGGTDVVSSGDLTSMSQNYYDDQGRKFVSNGSGTYTYNDGTTNHTFRRNGTTGDFTEFGTGSEVITGNRMKTSADNFGFNYGNSYRDLHTGDTFKVGHDAPPTTINLPTGWMLTNTGWVDATGRPLSPMDARRADSIVDHNNRVNNNNR